MASKSRGADRPAGPDIDAGEPPADLAGAVVGGVLWKVMTKTVGSATRFVVVVVLARLLTPEDYGVAGMAMVVTSFALIFTDPALGAALVQRPTIDERDRSTAFWIAAGLGAGLTVAGIAGSGLVADFFGEEQVQELVVATSLCFVVVSLAVVHRALLLRRLAYRTLEIREMTSIVVGGAVAVAVAVAGYGPWAIIANFVAYSVTSTILVWALVDWRPRAPFSGERARSLAGFSTRMLAATLLSWGNQNLDKALVGRVLGAAALGAYSLAYTAMLLPTTIVGQPVRQAVIPAYSRIQRDAARLERAWLRSKRVSVVVVAPFLVALAVTAPEFVHVLFGTRWDDAVVPLQLLCVGGLANTLTTLNWALLQARGEAGILLRVTVLSSAVTWAAFAGGLVWGIVGVAALYALARWLLVMPATLMTTRAVGFDYWATLRAGAEMIPASLGAAAVGLALRLLLDETALPEAVRLVLVGSAVVVVFAGIVLALTPSLLGELQEAARRRPWRGTGEDRGLDPTR